jgi:hypothetical protein
MRKKIFLKLKEKKYFKLLWKYLYFRIIFKKKKHEKMLGF